MSALPEDVDALHHDALVQTHRPQPRGFADQRRAPERPAGCGQGAGTGHRAFFVAGGEDQQRTTKWLLQQRLHRLDDQREEALHVATAEPVPAVIGLAKAQRIGRPQFSIERHGVAVSGQHQATGTAAIAGQQVEFAGRDLRRLAGEAQLAEPGGQQLDHRTVALIPARLRATDGGCGNERGELLLERRNGHR